MAYKNTYQVEVEQFGYDKGLSALIKNHPEYTSFSELVTLEEQRHCGDFSFWDNEDLTMKNLEIKSEEKFTGNFYFEWFDNVATKRNGWTKNLDKCDCLLYCFKDKSVAFFFPEWRITRLYLYHCELEKKYPMIESSKCKTQKITPVGMIVPVADKKLNAERIFIA